jgi:Na+/H+-dicarboxylate symporter
LREGSSAGQRGGKSRAVAGVAAAVSHRFLACPMQPITAVADPLPTIELSPLGRLSGSLQQLVRGKLWAKVLVGLALGIGTGLLLGPSLDLVSRDTAHMVVSWLALPGTLFLAVVQMIVIPLVVASVIRGLAASESAEHLKAIGGRAVLYFVGTSTLAICLGVGLGALVEPGKLVDAAGALPVGDGAAAAIEAPSFTSLPETIVSVLPRNPLASMVGGEMLQIVLFAIIFGLAMVTMPQDKTAPLFDLLGSLQEVCMTVVKWALRLAPLAVFGLISRVTAQLGLDALAGVGAYVATVLGGLLILMIVYLILVATLGRTRPLVFLRAVREVQLLAFSTSSSAAVMPLSMKTAEEQLAVRPSTARFLIPLGATINMDGTALYQGVATAFLAQVYGIDLPPHAIALVVLTAVAASIGSPGTPGVGIVILSSVLASAGIPAAGIALLIGVDRLLDMARTTINVTGDLTACLVLDRWLPDRSHAPPAGAAESPA